MCRLCLQVWCVTENQLKWSEDEVCQIYQKQWQVIHPEVCQKHFVGSNVIQKCQQSIWQQHLHCLFVHKWYEKNVCHTVSTMRALLCEQRTLTKVHTAPAGPQTFMSSSAHVAPRRPVRFHCIISVLWSSFYCVDEPLFICQDVFYCCSLRSWAGITMTEYIPVDPYFILFPSSHFIFNATVELKLHSVWAFSYYVLTIRVIAVIYYNET